MNTTYWPADHPNIDLLTEATTAGVDPAAIADTVGRDSLSRGLRAFSNRDTGRIQKLIDTRTRRNQLLDDLAHLAACLGHDATAKRAAADRKMTDQQITRLIRDTRTYAQSKGVDIRTAAEKTPRKASAAQVAYILDLLAERRRTGDDSGFYTGPTTRDGIAAMTAAEASAYIDSLKGTY